MAVGRLLTLDQVWRLSQRWYADRLSEAYVGRTTGQAEQIFASLGLTDRFWRFDAA